MVEALDIRFGVQDLSTFEVLRIYRECRDVFRLFLEQRKEIDETLKDGDMQKYGVIMYNKMDPVFDAIHNWLRNSVDVDVLGYSQMCRNGLRKDDPLREYIAIQRQKLI